MTQVFRSPHVYHEPYEGGPELGFPPLVGDHRVAMVAIPVARQPALFNGGSPLQCMHVMVLRSAEAGAPGTIAAETPVLPPAPLPAATCRKLFPEPGLRRIVRWCDFRDTLAAQLAQPQRLLDTHRLPCYVQVYEVTAAQRWEALVAALQGEAGAASPLQALTAERAAQLQLLGLLRARPRPAHRGEEEPEVLLPYDLIFRLQLAHDPTGEAAGQEGARPRRPAAAAATPAPPATQPLNAIPESFVKPWEFRFTREEALYDMRVAAVGGGLGAVFRRLRGWFRGRRGWHKWQVLLWGKSLQEQLWGVRPPPGGLTQPAIREWARTTLERAGYDPHAMLAEWEIFWRRKGV